MNKKKGGKHMRNADRVDGPVAGAPSISDAFKSAHGCCDRRIRCAGWDELPRRGHWSRHQVTQAGEQR